MTVLSRTALYEIHRQLGAKLAPFAGYEMPIHYPSGIVFEHQHTRRAAGLFDVSHMGVLEIKGESAAHALERLIPCDIQEMSVGQMRYGIFMLDTGGILDDLLITRQESGYLLVVNASRKVDDIAYLQDNLPASVLRHIWDDPVMIALQGPQASLVLARFFPEVGAMPFMTAKSFGKTWVSRSGYTGEDGFEMIMTAEDGVEFTKKLLEAQEVKPVGLGARDSLRLEAGLCLYGHELKEDITPVEAGISWCIGKRRRQERGFLAAEIVLPQLNQGCSRKRIGLTLSPGSIPREGAVILTKNGQKIGFVTSGGHSPTLGHPIAMGYVDEEYSSIGSVVAIQIREQIREANVVKLPFVPHSYYKNK